MSEELLLSKGCLYLMINKSYFANN
ncbi:hypothetical protein DESC_60018 [Desulfosarcina cetonica]|nr:hypothetical protein DESC_60018 [Desulfosarcina cetonica]